jgi:hypothetical protein
MRSRDIARNRQAKPGTAFILVACVVEPQEGLEHILS